MSALIDTGSATAARKFMSVKCGIMLRGQVEDNFYPVLSLKRGSFSKFLNHRL